MLVILAAVSFRSFIVIVRNNYYLLERANIEWIFICCCCDWPCASNPLIDTRTHQDSPLGSKIPSFDLCGISF